MADRLNISDRRIVDTGRLTGGDYRVAGVPIVGRFDDDVPVSVNPPEEMDEQTDSPASGEVGVPTDLNIESQTIKVQPDGSALVDVTLSFEEAQGAARHEVRIAKV